MSETQTARNKPRPHGLTIYVACYNRPEFAKLAIASVLQQTDKKFLLRISDNSTTDDVQQMVARDFDGVPYVRRKPSTAACFHGNRLLDECETSHVMIMHDDDLLTPDYVCEMRRFMAAIPQAVCYSCNGPTIDSRGSLLRKYFYLSAKKHELKFDRLWLVKRWFSYGTFAVAALPAYIYNLSKVEGIRFDSERYGQINDFIFIHQCIGRSGGIAWLNKPLYVYRVHVSQDSANITLKSWRLLCQYIMEQHASHYFSPEFSLVRALYLRRRLKKSSKPDTARTIDLVVARLLIINPSGNFRRLIRSLINRFQGTRTLGRR